MIILRLQHPRTIKKMLISMFLYAPGKFTLVSRHLFASGVRNLHLETVFLRVCTTESMNWGLINILLRKSHRAHILADHVCAVKFPMLLCDHHVSGNTQCTSCREKWKRPF